MKVVFMGTPDFALKPLNALLLSKHEVAAVVTQPDKPRGRNKKLLPPPVKEFAQKSGIRVLQYSKLKNEAPEDLRLINPDIMVTAAYGQILTSEILKIPRYGVINVHASVLPEYRGAMPVHWAVINGEKTTGITIMQTDEGLDTGDILLTETIMIADEENTGDILDKLSGLGARLLIEALDCIEKGKIIPVKQNPAKASYYPIIDKNNAAINWNKSASEINNLVRGLNPSPVAFTMLEGQSGLFEMIKIWKSKPVCENDFPDYVSARFSEFEAGEIIRADKGGLWVRCGSGVLELIEIQAPNSNKMPAQAFLNGRKIPLGTRLR